MSAKMGTPVIFNGKSYDSMSLLLNNMALNWNDGRKFLFSGELQKFLRKIDSKATSSAATAMTSYRNTPAEQDHIFWKWIYRQGGIQNLYWKGRNFGDWKRVSTLLRKDTGSELRQLFVWMLKEQQISIYTKSIGRPEGVIRNIKFLERNYSKSDSKFRKSKAIPLMIHLIDQTKSFDFDGESFQTLEEFGNYLQNLTHGSREEFLDTIKPLFLDEYNFAPVFEAWILNQGGQTALASWNSKYQEGLGAADDDLPDANDNLGQPNADHQDEKDFAKTANGFEVEFLDLLTRYPDALFDFQKFFGLMNDLFPQKRLQVNLMVTLQKMDIVKAIKDAPEMTPTFTHRFIKRLANDFGVKNSFAEWAVSVWCVCYGKQVLGKKGSVEILTII